MNDYGIAFIIILLGFLAINALGRRHRIEPKPKKARKTKEEIKLMRKPCFRSEDQYSVEEFYLSTPYIKE